MEGLKLKKSSQYNQVAGGMLYTVQIIDETVLKDINITNKYSFDLDIQMKSQPNGRISYVFDGKFSNHKFDLAKPYKKQEKLLLELIPITEHLRVGLNQRGDIIRLRNHQEIQEKWEALSPFLYKKHQGDMAHGYFDLIADRLSDEKHMREDIGQYKMLGFVFNGNLNFPTDTKRKASRSRKHSNMIHCLPVEVIEFYTLAKEQNDESILRYEITGDLNKIPDKNRKRISKYFKYYGIPDADVFIEKYNGDYFIDSITSWMKTANIEFVLSNGRGYQRKVSYQIDMNTNFS